MNCKTALLTSFLFIASTYAGKELDPEIKTAAISGVKFLLERASYDLQAFHREPRQLLIDKCQEKLAAIPAATYPRVFEVTAAECELIRGLSGSELEEEARHIENRLQLIVQQLTESLRKIETNACDKSRLNIFVIQNQLKEYNYAAAANTIKKAIDDCEELVELLKNYVPLAQFRIQTGKIQLFAGHFDLQPIPQEIIDGVLAEDEVCIHEMCSIIASYIDPLKDIKRKIEEEKHLKVEKLGKILKLATLYGIPLMNNTAEAPATMKVLDDLRKHRSFTDDGKTVLLDTIDRSIAQVTAIFEQISQTPDEQITEVWSRIKPERICAASTVILEEMVDAHSLPIPITSLQKARLVKEQSLHTLSERLTLLNNLKDLFNRPEVEISNKETIGLILLPWNLANPAKKIHDERILK